MKKSILLGLFFIVLTSFTALKDKKIENVGYIFKSWNQATFSSLKKEKQQFTDERLVSYAEQKLASLKRYWEIEDDDEINENSIRFQFLKVISGFVNRDDYFIIEANKTGETVTVQNYLICQKNKKTKIYRFKYVKDKGWELQEKFLIKGNLNINPEQYYTLFGYGNNKDDVIITRFKKGEVQKSFYYVYSTMSDFSLLFDI